MLASLGQTGGCIKGFACQQGPRTLGVLCTVVCIHYVCNTMQL